MMAAIELTGVSHAYVPGEFAVQDIHLKWTDGVSSALLGPSGCGKTTLLKIISGLLKPTEGQVLLDGEPVNHLAAKERNIAQVFQFPVVYETLNVYDNLAFPLRNRGMPTNVIQKRVHEIAELLGLTDFLKRNAARLGTAEKQLVALGRGVVRKDIAAILLDEPMTVIDPQQKWHIRRKLKRLQRELALTMIYVTHDQHEALTFADQVTVMNVGVTLQTGSPQDLHDRPAAPFVGYFIGSPGMNIFDATLNGDQVRAGNLSITLPSGVEKAVRGHELKIGIRPDFVNVAATNAPHHFECVVTAVHMTGTAKILNLSGAGLSFKARVADSLSIQAGTSVWAHFPQKSTMIYADERVVNLGVEENSA